MSQRELPVLARLQWCCMDALRQLTNRVVGWARPVRFSTSDGMLWCTYREAHYPADAEPLNVVVDSERGIPGQVDAASELAWALTYEALAAEPVIRWKVSPWA